MFIIFNLQNKYDAYFLRAKCCMIYFASNNGTNVKTVKISLINLQIEKGRDIYYHP